MKFFIVLLAVVAIAHADYTQEEEDRWMEFKNLHSKMFLSPGKEAKRKATFIENANAVDAHNELFEKGEVTFTLQIHPHSDLTEEAFMARYTGVEMPADARASAPSPVETRAYYPDSLDLRNSGGVGAIRDQQQCGSCWTFSTCAALEYGYWRKTGYLGDLAEQELVDCVYQRSGCNGGWMPTAMEYVGNAPGIAWENDYPYQATYGSCRGASFASRKSVWLNKQTPSNQVGSDDASIKAALYNNGVLSICVDASNWGGYSSGIYQSANYANPSCSHAVALVGYGTDNGVPYWLIRNSWNTWWGEKGYMRADARRCPNTGRNYGGIMIDYAFYPTMF